MYEALHRLLFASIAALAFIVLSRATGAKASARVKFFAGFALALLFIVPVKMPLLRVEIPQNAAESALAGAVYGEGEAQPAPPVQGGQSGAQNGGEGETKSPLSAKTAVFALYAAGACITLFCILYRYRKAVKFLRRCGRAPSARESAIFARLCEKHGLRKAPLLLVCPAFALGSSVTYGVWRQNVIIADKFEEQELALILAHELTHCKRKDALFKAVLALLCSLYWFNPIIHAFIREMNEICEQSCDETLLKNSGFEEKERYCRLLIETALSYSAEKKFLFSAFKGGKNFMKQRIKNILGKKSRAVTAIALVSVLLIAALTSAIYLATPPENIKVAYFFEPQQMKDFRHIKDDIGDYTNNNFYNMEYSYSKDSDEVEFSGIVNGKEFNVVGSFVTTSYNGARVLYTGEDKLGNYNVKCIRFQFAQTTEYTDLPIRDHNSGEKARHQYSGWFVKYAEENAKYKNVIQIYLNPVDTDDIIAIEIFLEEDFITDFITSKNIKFADVDHEKGYYLDLWDQYWLKEQGLLG